MFFFYYADFHLHLGVSRKLVSVFVFKYTQKKPALTEPLKTVNFICNFITLNVNTIIKRYWSRFILQFAKYVQLPV